MACMWNAALLPLLQLAALHFGWWRFEAQGGLMLGFPIDLYLGWILLWGVIPMVTFRRTNLALIAIIFFALDVVLMPQAGPVVKLGKGWYVGDLVGVFVCLVPSQLLARWTRDGRLLRARAVLQVIVFSILPMGVLPAVILEQTHKNALSVLTMPGWCMSLWFQALMIPGVLGLSAVQEFVRRGGGTPIPYDPPGKLVTSGPYAYLRNPMQVSAVLVLLLLGIVLRSYWVAAAGVMACIYSAGLATWDEGDDLTKRFGEPWQRYRVQVRNWSPRWRPWYATEEFQEHERSARIYVARTCGMCSQVARWLRRHGPAGLEILAAEEYPHGTLTRMTYDPADGGPQEKGIAAFARALEHLHLGWALLGFAMRLPLICQGLQLLVDSCGGGEREVASHTCSRQTL
jgi:protein-S-isoprenylcysteine O-methyltransferase Ste14